MANLLPILLLGGAAVVLSKKKKKKKPNGELGGSCASLPPSVHERKEAEGLVCNYETGKWVPKPELDGGEGGLPPKYLENEKVDAAAWGAMKSPGAIPLRVGQNSFTNFGGMDERISVIKAGSSDPNIISISPDEDHAPGQWNPIAIFKPRSPGIATLAVRRSDGSEYALNVTVTGD